MVSSDRMARGSAYLWSWIALDSSGLGGLHAHDTPTSRCGFCLQDVGVVPASDRATRSPSIDASDRLTEARERCKTAHLPVRASPWASAERATATSLPGYMTAVTHLRAT